MESSKFQSLSRSTLRIRQPPFIISDYFFRRFVASLKFDCARFSVYDDRAITDKAVSKFARLSKFSGIVKKDPSKWPFNRVFIHHDDGGFGRVH